VPDGAGAGAGIVAEGDKVVYGVRPEYVRVVAEQQDGAVLGEVSAVENLGVSVLVTVEAGEQSLRAVVPESDEPEIGDAIHLVPSPGRVLLYRADGDGELIGS
jgi:multiple sugar transport system ATP-binding protein